MSRQAKTRIGWPLILVVGVALFFLFQQSGLQSIANGPMALAPPNIPYSRETNLDTNGELCSSGETCRACETSFTYNFTTPSSGAAFKVGGATYDPATSKYSYTNVIDDAIIWQTFHVDGANQWTNYCAPGGIQDSAHGGYGCDVVSGTNGSIFLTPGETAYYLIDPGNTVVDRRWFCQNALGASTTCTSHTGAQCVSGTPTYVNSCGQAEDPKEERCGMYGLTCTQVAVENGCGYWDFTCLGTPEPSTDAWCVNSDNHDLFASFFVNPDDETRYCVKQSGLTGVQSCAKASHLRKPGVGKDDLDTITTTNINDIITAGVFNTELDFKVLDQQVVNGEPGYLFKADNPLCIPLYGDAACDDTATCVRAKKPMNSDDKDIESQIFRALEQETSVSIDLLIADWELDLNKDRDVLEEFGICIKGGSSGGLAGFAEKLGITQTQLIWVLVGLGGIVLLPMILPKRGP